MNGATGVGTGGEEGNIVLVVVWEGTGDAIAVIRELSAAIYIVGDLQRSCEPSERTSRGWEYSKGK